MRCRATGNPTGSAGRPSASSARSAFAARLMNEPSAVTGGPASSTVTRWPSEASPMAVAAPAIPAPMTMTCMNVPP